ncbi:MAG: translational GTPase TypA [Acidimicrobiales bacterium]|nr:translational GTPase TypA [Acidimicrobiaceae bacterium]MDP6161822.1 translational GTPase TypA [Acidimicrobiales bacterium]MDP6323175.1 translational GTPase TypA [Acidimicrobiales bacterium]HJO40002.1 translational GTPase TypA [Acidimicrobiales bacterium]
MTKRPELRNIAVIAHVDHGKTTLIDALLKHSGAFRSNEEVAERVMDSMDLEREKGITILAKNTAIKYEDVKINIVDTPGHADFGGEVERALTMVDGVLLLVDSAEGPRPQTRFVLRKALEADLSIVVVINKIDRPDARISEVIDEIYELFLDLDASEAQIDFPIVYTDARLGIATLNPDIEGTNLDPFYEVLLERVPAPTGDENAPLQVHVTNLDASPYLGRLAVCRIVSGVLKQNSTVAWCRTDGSIEQVKVGSVTLTEALSQVEVTEAGPGEIAYVSGVEGVTIGESFTDLENPHPLPVISVDEPTLSMSIGVNTSPVAGSDGDKLTARQIKARLEEELIGNVSIRVLPTERPDAWEVQGRGELQLAVLVETMKREGFEMTVGKPSVLLREIDGKFHEPVEELTIEVPEEHVGAVTQLLGERRAEMKEMKNYGTGWVKIDYVVASRALIGFRTEFLTETRGTGILSHVFSGWEEWMGEMRLRQTGSVIADRKGSVTGHAITNLQERTTLFVSPNDEVYAGMIVGENPRAEDMDVNICKEKKLTNVRAAASDDTIRLTPPRKLSLEQALEYIAEDECVEITPKIVRLRKTVLDSGERARTLKKAKQGRV